MSECRLVLAHASADAGSRIASSWEAHRLVLRQLTDRGEVILGLPLLDDSGGYQGSLALVPTEAVGAYLEAEPLRRGGLWNGHAVHPFRIAPLPYRVWPDGPPSSAPTHTVVVARDGGDPGAQGRRLAAREAHFDHVRPAAAGGTLMLGGAVLDAPGGRMVGSVAVTAHPTLDAARAWWRDDPYVVGDVWRETTWHLTRIEAAPRAARPDAA